MKCEEGNPSGVALKKECGAFAHQTRPISSYQVQDTQQALPLLSIQVSMHTLQQVNTLRSDLMNHIDRKMEAVQTDLMHHGDSKTEQVSICAD